MQFTHAGALGRPTATAVKDECPRTLATSLFDRASLQGRHDAGKNMVFAATPAIAWESIARASGNTTLMQYDPPLYVGLQAELDYANDVDPGSVIAGAGPGAETVARVTHELQQHFAGAASPRLLTAEAPAPDQLFAYAYLWKHLVYDERPGVSTRLATDGDTFVIDVPTVLPEERLVVASIAPRETLAETAHYALGVTGVPTGAPATWTLERFVVPRIHFDVLWKFRTTSVRYHFKLDAHGATLLSEAAQVPYQIPSMIVTRPSEPMQRPLMVAMAKRGARRPYFVLWLENTELLLADVA